jgi:Rrf2 family transcriptional regulator, nitric oxide-sensitive transcriptional repressor
MFSQTTEYALRVVVFLGAMRKTPAKTVQIAAATRVPEGYLSKILQGLGRAGIVKAKRGLHGGSVLARDPEELTVLDIVNATGPLPRIRTCPLELPSHGTNLCPLHKRLDDAMAMVEKALKESTVADLLAEPTASIPLGELGTSAAAATRAAEAVFPVGRKTQLTVSPRGGRK